MQAGADRQLPLPLDRGARTRAHSLALHFHSSRLKPRDQCPSDLLANGHAVALLHKLQSVENVRFETKRGELAH